jgi:multisubunit Na+/H+ antiporter MnhF subunit
MQEEIYIIYLLAAAGLLCLFRIARGPTAPDRVVALDALVPITAVIMVLFSLYTGDELLLDTSIVYTILGFIGTLVISKYLMGERLGDSI